ncbi:MAG: triple tyrosine motif-containing protein, partial [Bacteroidota bacterium]
MKTSLYLLSIICLLCFCCQEQKSSNSGRQQYKIEPTEIEPLPYYVNRTGDTIDVSLPMKSNAILDTNYRLPLKAKPLTLEKVTAFPNHVTRASEPIVIPFEESMWDTLVHGDTLRIATRPLKGRGIEVERSFIKRAGAPTIKGQPDYAITSLGADQGLSNTFHRKFAKDDKGNIWFLSYIGLTRYDGVTMENYDLPGKGITSFMSMLCDSDQNIWVAGREKMIRYNGTQFEVYDDFPSSEEALFISDLAEDHENNIWFLGGDNGFGYIKDSIIYSFPDLTGKVGQAGKFFSDSSENMWMMISRNRQLIKYDGTHFVSLKSSIPTATERSFSSLTADDEGNIWMLGSIGQQATLVKFDGNNFYVYSKEQGFDGKVSRSIFDNIEITSEGLVLVTSAGKGLTEFDGVYFTKISTDQGLSGNLSDLLEDDAGNIWITSGDYENLFTYHPKRFKHLAYDKMDSIGLGGTGYLMNKFGATWWYNRDNKAFLCLDKNSVYHYQTDVSFAYLFFEDQRGGIWSNSTGESAFHLYKDSIAEIKIDAYIPSILDISDQEIWFATVANLVQLDKTGKTTLDYDVDFLGNGERFFNIGIAKDSKRQLWGATMNGKIANYSEDRFTYYNFPVKKNSTFIVTNPIVDDADNVWFIYGTQALIKYDGERFWQYDFSDQMKGEIQSFLLDDVGNIWITSLGDGVIRFDGKQIQFLTTKDGLLENNTSIINKDFEGRIWVVSVAGMNIIERHQLEDGKEQFHIYTYGKTDGLYANFFPIVVGSNFSEEQNTAFIRGMTASSYFDPDQLKIPAPPKNLSLAQLDINQELIDYSRLQDSSYRATLTYGEQINQSFSKSTRFTNYPLDLTLPHYLDHLAFHFTAINWEAPHKIRYSFKMKGLESDWSTPQTEPIIDYRNLPHGQYTLMARVKNESNVWSEPFEYQFTIRPPWWLSPIAYIVYVLAFLLFLYSLFLYLRRRLQLENAYKQEQAEAQRLKELDTFKSRLYTNL